MSPFIRTPVILDKAPTVLQPNLILTNYICNDPFSELGHVPRYILFFLLLVYRHTLGSVPLGFSILDKI